MAELPISERFQILRQLGEGGMGVVYEALDREQGVKVALKRLHETHANALLRLKGEFRSLRDIQHANLVSLGELVESRGRWFFTMELVDGTDLLGYVTKDGSREGEPSTDRSSKQSTHEATQVVSTPPLAVAALESSARGAPAVLPAPSYDEARLRQALIQLAQGLQALHDAGKVHRDIKPPNLLVTREGRLVISDFGLVVDRQSSSDLPLPAVVQGTPPYMAPELALSPATDPAADWYSVGVVLYRVLVGRLPFRGSFEATLRQKLGRLVLPPSECVQGIPADLDDLCFSLLHPDPIQRPDAAEVLARLGVRSSQRRSTRLEDPQTFPLVGREEELSALSTAFKSVLHTRIGRTVIIQGESGVGKTALVRKTAERLSVDEPNLLWLTGRCHERESVPYKAFDGVADDLTETLRAMSPAALESILPSSAALLTQLFPVLQDVPALNVGMGAPERDQAVDTGSIAREQRASLFALLRQLLTQLAARRPCVIVLDDLQWADPDSLALLRELLRPPSPRILIIATVRTNVDDPWMPPLEGSLGNEVSHLALQPLRPEAAATLVRLLSRQMDAAHDVSAATLAASAGGHPLFIQELVLSGGFATGANVDDALAQRVQQLPPPARAVLSAVALAGKPLPNHVLRSASGIGADAYSAARATLHAERLVRTGGLRRGDHVEPFHDRIREVVADRLPPEERASVHRQLALALATMDRPDPELLATHWLAAGDREQARPHLWLAAIEADRALAFERSVRLFQQCVDVAPEGDPEARRPIVVRLAEALGKAARSADAADAFEAAAQMATGLEASSLRQRAADKFLRAGHFARGIELLEGILRDLGHFVPRNRAWVAMWAIAARIRLLLRGIDYDLRSPEELNPVDVHRVDVLHAAASGLGLLDTFMAAGFSAQHLIAALELGDRDRIFRGLSSEYALQGAVSGTTSPATEAIAEAASRLAEGRRELEVRNEFMRAMVMWVHGSALDSVEMTLRTERFFVESKMYGEDLSGAQHFTNAALWFLGRWKELSERVSSQLASALERQDVFASTNLVSGTLNSVFVLDGDVARARRLLDQELARWPRDRFLTVHFYELFTLCQLDLYSGFPERALERLEQEWRALEGSFLLRVPMVAHMMFDLRARTVITLASRRVGQERHRLIVRARADVRRVGRTTMECRLSARRLLEASLLELDGRSEAAATAFLEAERGLKTHGMMLFAAAARFHRGQLLGDAGVDVRESATREFRTQGVAVPEHMMRLLVADVGATATPVRAGATVGERG